MKWVPNPAGPGVPKPDQLKYVTINGKEAAYYPSCWEGCDLIYHIVDEAYEYKSSYRCGTSPSCSRAEEIATTKYYADFISLIQSVRFK